MAAQPLNGYRRPDGRVGVRNYVVILPVDDLSNAVAAVVVGIEPNWAERVVEGIAETGKPVAGFSIERNGDLKTLSAAARVAQQFLQQASELTREPIERHELTISIKCGESDTTTGLGSCPTVAQAVDRHVEEGGTV